MFTQLWIAWFILFGVIEGWALLDKREGDTLSEHIWKWFRIRDKPRQWTWRRAVLGVFMMWLSVHMVAGI